MTRASPPGSCTAARCAWGCALLHCMPSQIYALASGSCRSCAVPRSHSLSALPSGINQDITRDITVRTFMARSALWTQSTASLSHAPAAGKHEAANPKVQLSMRL